MKKLYAMLVALFTAIFGSVSYQMVEEKDYQSDIYYKVDVAEAPDYRAFYTGTSAASNKVSCKTTNYSAQGKLITYTSPVTFKGYWLENDMIVKESDIPESKSYTFATSSYIILPFDGTLLTDSTTNDGHSMVVLITNGSKEYRLTFSDMDRWYCCMSRTKPEEEDGQVRWSHTGDNQKGKSFKQGNVLGMADGNKTTVMVHEMKNGSAKATTLKNMYLGI